MGAPLLAMNAVEMCLTSCDFLKKKKKCYKQCSVTFEGEPWRAMAKRPQPLLPLWEVHHQHGEGHHQQDLLSLLKRSVRPPTLFGLVDV